MSIFSATAADMSAIQPILALWVAAFVILLGDVFVWKRRLKFMSPLLAVLAAGYALRSALTQDSGEFGSTVFARSIAVDPLASAGNIVALISILLSLLIAWTYLANRDLDHGEYYVLLLLSGSGAMLMASANDLIVLFLGLETMSFGLYVMAGFARTQARSEEASIKYFLLGAFASAFLLYGIALVYGATESTNLLDIAGALRNGSASTPMMAAGVALLIVGLGFKAALVPFHQWAPDVYEGAPTSVTAYMAAIAKIGAFAAFLRLFDILGPVKGNWLPVVEVLAILTMVFGNLLALTQSNIKRMLAYSSIAHAGYLLVAVAALGRGALSVTATKASDLAISGALFYLMAYSFMTLGAFGVLVYLSHRGKDYERIGDLKGLARTDPYAAYSMLFFLLSLGGIPPTMGFIGKLLILYVAATGGYITLAVVMALTSVMAAYYYLRIVWVMCFEELVETEVVVPASRNAVSVSIAVSAAATVLFGVMPGLLFGITLISK